MSSEMTPKSPYTLANRRDFVLKITRLSLWYSWRHSNDGGSIVEVLSSQTPVYRLTEFWDGCPIHPRPTSRGRRRLLDKLPLSCKPCAGILPQQRSILRKRASSSSCRTSSPEWKGISRRGRGSLPGIPHTPCPKISYRASSRVSIPKAAIPSIFISQTAACQTRRFGTCKRGPPNC